MQLDLFCHSANLILSFGNAVLQVAQFNEPRDPQDRPYEG